MLDTINSKQKATRIVKIARVTIVLITNNSSFFFLGSSCLSNVAKTLLATLRLSLLHSKAQDLSQKTKQQLYINRRITTILQDQQVLLGKTGIKFLRYSTYQTLIFAIIFCIAVYLILNKSSVENSQNNQTFYAKGKQTSCSLRYYNIKILFCLTKSTKVEGHAKN